MQQMEVIKCECNRLIMFLSPQDMKKYGIDSNEDLMGNVRTMLFDSGISKDFSDSRRLLVKVFESKKGGCELFITRLGEGISVSEPPASRKAEYIYKFKDLDSLLLTCRAVCSYGYDGVSDVRYDGDRKEYYLILEREYESISEFGAVLCRFSALAYIEEHCMKLCNCTVDILGNLV